MKGVLSFLFLGFFFIYGYSQTFSKTYDLLPQTNERGGRLLEHENHVYVVDSYICPVSNNQSFSILKFELGGTLIWQEKISFIDRANWETFIFSSDTIVCAGHANGVTNPASTSFLVQLLNTQGDSLDVYEFEFSQYNIEAANCFGIVEYENEYFLYGDALEVNNNNPIGVIVRVNKSGELLYVYKYRSGTSSNVFSLSTHPDLGLVFIDQESNGFQNPRFRKLIKFDPIHIDDPFTELYSVEYDFDNHLTTLQVLEDGTMVFLDKITGGITTRNGLRFVDSDGELLFNYEYDEFLSESSLDWPSFSMVALSKTFENSILACGSGNFSLGFPSSIQNGYIMKVSQDGILEWQRYYVTYDGTDIPTTTSLSDVIELHDGTLMASGRMARQRNGETENDLWLIRLDENGCLNEHDCDSEQFTTSVNQNITSSLEINISPNPFTETIRILLSKNSSNQAVIYTLQGEKVLSFNLDNNDNYINTDDWEKGIYMVQIMNKHQVLLTEKIIKLGNN